MDNPPAFPSTPLGQNGMPNDNPQYGMTLRDYFAAHALLGQLSYNECLNPEEISQWSYEYADAMLKERNK